MGWGKVNGLASGCAVLCAALVWVPAAQAGPRPNLAVSALGEPPARVEAGKRLTLRTTVINRGRKGAKATTVRAWLSKDKKRDRRDVALTGKSPRVKALKRRGRIVLKAKLTIPAKARAGKYHLLVCVDPASRIREASERDNCRASRRKVRVIAAARLFPLAAKPLAVTPGLDAPRAQTKTIDFGDRFLLTGADGTQYRLQIPDRGLLSSTRVTVTPLSSAAGLPGTFVGGVDIQPAGLQLNEPATLTIVPPGGAPAGDLVGFAARSDGTDAHAHPLGGTAPITVKLTRFGIAGALRATAEQREALRARVPARPSAQLLHVATLSAPAAAARASQAPTPTSDVGALAAAYHADVVAPLVNQARTDASVAPQAIGELFGWMRSVELVGAGDDPRVKPLADAASQQAIDIIRNAIQAGYQRCVRDHELEQVASMLRWARLAVLLGVSEEEGWVNQAVSCARFEVDFDSTVTSTAEWDNGEQQHSSRGVWRVRSQGTEIDWMGNGTIPLSHTRNEWTSRHNYGCSDSSKADLIYEYATLGPTTPGSWTVRLDLDLNLREPGAPPPPADRGAVLSLFDQTAPTERVRFTKSGCGVGAPQSVDEQRESWQGVFDVFHGEDHDPHDFVRRFRDWTPGSGAILGTKRYSRSKNCGPFCGTTTEDTTITIRHAPR